MNASGKRKLRQGSLNIGRVQIMSVQITNNQKDNCTRHDMGSENKSITRINRKIVISSGKKKKRLKKRNMEMHTELETKRTKT